LFGFLFLAITNCAAMDILVHLLVFIYTYKHMILLDLYSRKELLGHRITEWIFKFLSPSFYILSMSLLCWQQFLKPLCSFLPWVRSLGEKLGKIYFSAFSPGQFQLTSDFREWDKWLLPVRSLKCRLTFAIQKHPSHFHRRLLFSCSKIYIF
jgi:hypothetical protein